MKPVVRPATAEDVASLIDKPSPKTIRAFAVEWEGQVAAIAGVTIERQGCTFFSDIREGEYPKTAIWRASLDIVNRIKAMNLPCVAIANPDKPTSSAYLERLGFTFHGETEAGRIYRL